MSSDPITFPDQAHFLAHPWSRALLTSPTAVILPESPRREVRASTEDQLFADVLSQRDTLNAMMSYHNYQPHVSRTSTKQERFLPIVSTLLDLGYRLNGFPGVLHGGIVVTLIDESMGIYLSRNCERGAFSPTGKPEMCEGWSGETFTADLRVQFKRPVKTPQVVRVDVSLKKVEGGRKYFVEAKLVGSALGEDVVLATGEALWIATKSSKL